MPLSDPACFRLDRSLHCLWRPPLASGKLALLDDDPRVGKSLWPADLAAWPTRVGQMPDGSGRRDGGSFWPWANPTLPHDAGRGR